jgi:DNA-binding MarR family transcriptional regulator
VHFALRRTLRAIAQRYDDELRGCGLRATQFTVLAVIRALEPATQNEIARRAEMDATTLTRALRPLERAGLIVVREGPSDRRQRIVRSTRRGRCALQHAARRWENTQRELHEKAGPSELRALVAALDRCREAIAR